MRTLIIRPPFPLSKQSEQAYRMLGDTVRFLRRDRDLTADLGDVYDKYDFVVNLGNSNMNADCVDPEKLINPPDLVEITVSPRNTMMLFGELWPHYIPGREFWVKRPGRKGKTHSQYEAVDSPPILRSRHEALQGHIYGNEFRINIVNGKVVQCSRRYDDDYGNRRYEWIGVDGLRQRNGLRFARAVAHTLHELWPYHIVGVDAIKSRLDGRFYLLEVNSCPGINQETALRIRNILERRFE